MKILILILTVLFAYPTFGQMQNPETQKTFSLNPWEDVNGYRISVGYFRDFEAEVSYLISSYPRTEQGFGGLTMLVQNIGIGAGYAQDGNRHAIGGKLSYEVNLAIFSAQVATDFLASDQGAQYRISPRIGLSLLGIVTAYYTWNYNLRKQGEFQPARHVIALQVNVLDCYR